MLKITVKIFNIEGFKMYLKGSKKQKRHLSMIYQNCIDFHAKNIFNDKTRWSTDEAHR